jgi:hypothetical protein
MKIHQHYKQKSLKVFTDKNDYPKLSQVIEMTAVFVGIHHALYQKSYID